MADTYHALADAGYLDNTVLIVTFDEWGGFFDHVPPPQVIDDTNPDDVDHSGDSSTPTDGQLIPDYRQLGIRVPAIVVSNLAPRRVVHHGPFEHTSTLKMIESVFGLNSLTARDANAENLGMVLSRHPRRPVPGRHPDQQPGDGPGQRRGRDLQRGQCPVGVTQAGEARSAPARRGPCAAAIRLAYRVRHGRVRQRAPQEPALMTAGSAGSSGHPAAGLRGGLVARK